MAYSRKFFRDAFFELQGEQWRSIVIDKTQVRYRMLLSDPKVLFWYGTKSLT